MARAEEKRLFSAGSTCGENGEESRAPKAHEVLQSVSYFTVPPRAHPSRESRDARAEGRYTDNMPPLTPL